MISFCKRTGVLLLASLAGTALGAVPVFTSTSPSPVSGGLYVASGTVADVNADGKADITAMEPGASGGGKAYIVSGATGTVLRTFTSPNAETGGRFGTVTAIGDLNGDGKPEILIGASYENPGAAPSDAGRAYIFSGDSLVATPLNTLVSPGEAASGLFGTQVAALGDLTGDGKGEFAISALGEGKVYVYNSATLALLHTLTSPAGVTSLAVSGGRYDVTGDGVPDLLLLAANETIGAQTDAGRAYLINGATGGLVHTFVSPNPETAAAYFGGGAIQVPDVTGDSVADIVITAPMETVGYAVAGRVYLFNGATRALVRTTVTNDGADSYFGIAAELIDIDADGDKDLAIGSGYGISEGRIAFYDLATGDLVARLYDDVISANQQFQGPVALPDLEGDGKPNFLVNAPGGGGSTLAGKVYAYNGLTSSSSGSSTPIVFPARDPNDGPTTSRSYYLTSLGEMPLKFTGTGFSITGANASDFSIVGTPDTSDAVEDAVRTVSIVFDPSAAGTRTATLEITTNDPATPTRTVTLTGEGDPNPPTYAAPIYLARNTEVLVIDSATGNRHLLASPMRGNGPAAQTNWVGMTLDNAGNLYTVANDQATPLLRVSSGGDRSFFLPSLPMTMKIYRTVVASGPQIYGIGSSGTVLSIDTVGSAHSTVSSNSVGTGPTPYLPLCIAVHEGSSLLLGEAYQQRLLKVELATGNRTVVSSASVGTGDAIPFTGVISTPAGAVYAVAGSDKIYRVDMANGNRTVISSNSVGTGPTSQNFYAIAMANATDEAYVYDGGTGAILRVNLATGNRTTVSSLAGAVGTGPSLTFDGPPSAYSFASLAFTVTGAATASDSEWMNYE